jgi:hypothetical protein
MLGRIETLQSVALAMQDRAGRQHLGVKPRPPRQ